jgi:hypothetical protein
MEDDLLIGHEIIDRKKRVIELEKDQKKRLDFFERLEMVLIMLDHLEHDLDGKVTKLSKNDLKKLLVWKGVSLTKVRMAEKLELWKKLQATATYEMMGITTLPGGLMKMRTI